MTTTLEEIRVRAEERWEEQQRRVDELATLSAHLNAATARWLTLAWELRESGDMDEPAGFLAFRCGITTREAREYLRVAEALQELPRTREAFSQGQLTYTKVRALTRVATASSEARLLELAEATTAPQLQRALRAFRRVATEDARRSHELEYVSYHFDDDGALYLRARLAAEDGTVLIKALEAARERVVERRRAERAAAGRESAAADAAALEPPRPAQVEALLELAETSLAHAGAADGDAPGGERARLVVHVDAAALIADGEGRCEIDDGPVVSPETARRLGCDADLVVQVDRDGLPVSVGRTRRTVPPALRRLLEARDDRTCCFPGCERRRHLQAHHRRHWAHGGETSLDNLVLLCWQHHRLVHEGGYTIDADRAGGLHFRNRYGLLHPHAPPRPPPAGPDDLLAENRRQGLEIGPHTNRNGCGEPMDLDLTVSAIVGIVCPRRLAVGASPSDPSHT